MFTKLIKYCLRPETLAFKGNYRYPLFSDAQDFSFYAVYMSHDIMDKKGELWKNMGWNSKK
jgi:hypothetical protein